MSTNATTLKAGINIPLAAERKHFLSRYGLFLATAFLLLIAACAAAAWWVYGLGSTPGF